MPRISGSVTGPAVTPQTITSAASSRTPSMPMYGGIKITNSPDLENIRKLDLLPIPMLRRMMAYGIAIDRDHFHDLSCKLEREMLELEAEICTYIPPEQLAQFMSRSNLNDEEDYAPMNVNSGDQLAELFFDVLGIGKDRQLKRTKSGARVSTGKKQLEQLKRQHPVVVRVLEYRERAKLKNTYTDQLPKIARRHQAGTCWCGLKHWDETWRVHTEFLWTRTSTGRMASKNPNLQNVSVRTELGRAVRAGFIASPGCKLVAVDYSQEELRISAHYSQDRNLIRIFQLGLDPHAETARLIFRLGPDESPDKLRQRDPARHLNYGIAYGLTDAGLYDQLGVTYSTAGLAVPEWLTQEWCGELIRSWYREYGGVAEYQEQQHYRARRYGIVWTMLGRVRRIPEVYSVHRWIRETGLRQAGNAPIQGAAADIIRLAMGELQPKLEELRDLGIWVWPLLTVHDELVLEVEEDYAGVVAEMVVGVMENVLTDKESGVEYCRVPIKAESKIMDHWKKGD